MISKLKLIDFKLLCFVIFLSFPSIAFAENLINQKQMLKKIFESIVNIDAKIPENARTSNTLGKFREGSGVVIDSKNILTIGYLVLEAREITIGLFNGKKIPGKLTGYDPITGFGIVSPIIPTALKPLKIGNSDKIDIDEKLYILPSHKQGPGSEVKLVSRRPFFGWWEYYLENPIYTFPTNQSWAGSALTNIEGEILGIGSLFIRDATSPGIFSPGNMFVPVNLLKPILQDLKKYGHRKSDLKPYIGLSPIENNGKIIVSRVSIDGPSDVAGIKKNDVIISINGNLIKSLQNFYLYLWNIGKSEVLIDIIILRDGKKINFKVRSKDRMNYYVKNKTY